MTLYSAVQLEGGRVTFKTYSIFLVEDHLLVRRALRQLLEAEVNLTVVAEAGSAESALAQLSNIAPDLILTDLSLPGISGLELVEALTQQRPELTCLVVTGHVDPFYRAAAFAAGAACFVTKDDPDEVLEAVWQVLDGTKSELA